MELVEVEAKVDRLRFVELDFILSRNLVRDCDDIETLPSIYCNLFDVQGFDHRRHLGEYAPLYLRHDYGQIPEPLLDSLRYQPFSIVRLLEVWL